MSRRVLRGPRVLTEDGLRDDVALLIEDGLILDILDWNACTKPGVAEERLPESAILAPGFIDVQANGGGGVLFNETPTMEGACAIAAAHRRFGTTSLLPTVITDRPEVMAQAAGRSITLVVSPRPPSPTSRLQRSAGSSAKSRKAAAVMTSNTVIGAAALTRSTASSASARAAVSTRPWVSRMRSLKSTRCGEV